MKLTKLLSLALLSCSTLAFADSFWMHNGSLVRLVADGNARAFYYETPSDKMSSAGVETGTMLFSGKRVGNRYTGVSYVFSKYCNEPLPYKVSGTVKNEKTVIMTGKRPVYTTGCKNTGRYTTDTLKFTYEYSD